MTPAIENSEITTRTTRRRYISSAETVEGYRQLFNLQIQHHKASKPDLARRMNIERSSLTRLLNGDRTMSRKQQDKLVQLLKIDPVKASYVIYILGDPAAYFNKTLDIAVSIFLDLSELVMSGELDGVIDTLNTKQSPLVAGKIVHMLVDHKRRVDAVRSHMFTEVAL